MRRIVIGFVFFSTSVCFADGVASMVTPKNGECEEFYHLIEGVCVHATAMSGDANDMLARINKFKSTEKPTSQTRQIASNEAKEDPLCTKYKNRLKKYLSEGVMGINPATGKLEKIEGKQAEDVINDTKENVEILCG